MITRDEIRFAAAEERLSTSASAIQTLRTQTDDVCRRALQVSAALDRLVERATAHAKAIETSSPGPQKLALWRRLIGWLPGIGRLIRRNRDGSD